MLNDLSWPTRLLVAGFGVALGVMASGPVLDAPGDAGLVLLLAGLALELVVISAFPLVLGRADSRLRREVVEATAEIAGGVAEPAPALGRVVRSRAVALPWWLPGRGGGSGASSLVVLTAVGDGPARRVAAVVPLDLGLHGRDVPALLLVHPRHRDVAVVDDRVTAERLAAVDADPRWRAGRLPTDRSVVGGYAGLLAALAAGIAIGTGLVAVVVALAT